MQRYDFNSKIPGVDNFDDGWKLVKHPTPTNPLNKKHIKQSLSLFLLAYQEACAYMKVLDEIYSDNLTQQETNDYMKHIDKYNNYISDINYSIACCYLKLEKMELFETHLTHSLYPIYALSENTISTITNADAIYMQASVDLRKGHYAEALYKFVLAVSLDPQLNKDADEYKSFLSKNSPKQIHEWMRELAPDQQNFIIDCYQNRSSLIGKKMYRYSHTELEFRNKWEFTASQTEADTRHAARRASKPDDAQHLTRHHRRSDHMQKQHSQQIENTERKHQGKGKKKEEGQPNTRQLADNNYKSNLAKVSLFSEKQSKPDGNTMEMNDTNEIKINIQIKS